ncbi:MAG: glucosamine--fructose-6-phosphate aminotransferase [Hydrogenophilaceae bacterium]|nr:glucosamine--fructose-6-phosphate aminotransferase [Hydrogenophilaceae bacterium]
MAHLPNALHAWQTADFARALKAEIEHLGAALLPLERAINQGSYVGDAPLTVTVLQSADAGDAIEARLGVFFTEIVASCGCGGEPMEQNAYCEMQARIAKATAEAAFVVIGD